MSFDFSKLTNVKADDVELPPILPEGTYAWRITKHTLPETKSGGTWHRSVYFAQCMEAGEDVDEELLAEYLEKVDGKDLTKTKNDKTFLFDEEDGNQQQRALHDMTTFLAEHCQIETDDGTVQSMEDNCVGAEFLGVVKWEADSRNAEVMQARIRETAPRD